MDSSSTKKVTKLAVPVVLLGLLLLLSQRLPRPVMGVDGPARLSGPAVAIAYSPNGTLLCGTSDGTLQKYVARERRFRTFGLSGSGFSAARTGRIEFSPDGSSVFVATPVRPASLHVLDLETRNSLYSFIGPSDTIFDVSKDGRWAACGREKGFIVLDLKKPLPLPSGISANSPGRPGKNRHYYAMRRFGTNFSPVAMHFSPDSRTLAVGLPDQIALFDVLGDAKLPRVQSGMEGSSVPQQPSAPPAAFNGIISPLWLEWSPDGSKLAVMNSSNEIAMFDPSLKKLATNIPKTPAMGSSPVISPTGSGNLVWSPDGRSLFSGGDVVRRWSPDLQLEASYGVSGPVALSPDGKILLTSNKAAPGQYPYLLQWKIR
jgi:WD40 repeat protein